MKKRIASIILALVMLLSLLPTTAFATETPDYFSVTNTGTGTATLKWAKYDNPTLPTLQYSTDGTAFHNVTIGTTEIQLTQGATVYFKGDYTSASILYNKYIYLTCTGTGAKLKLGGDLTTLLNGTGNVSDLTSYTQYLFAGLFKNLDTGTKTGTGTIGLASGSTAAIQLPALPTYDSGAAYNAEIKSSTNADVTGSVSGTTLSLTANEALTDGEAFYVTVGVTGKNYKDYDVVITVTPMAHQHSFSYTADGAVLKATCVDGLYGGL